MKNGHDEQQLGAVRKDVESNPFTVQCTVICTMPSEYRPECLGYFPLACFSLATSLRRYKYDGNRACKMGHQSRLTQLARTRTKAFLCRVFLGDQTQKESEPFKMEWLNGVAKEWLVRARKRIKYKHYVHAAICRSVVVENVK